VRGHIGVRLKTRAVKARSRFPQKESELEGQYLGNMFFDICVSMGSADEYRIRAAEFRAKATHETDPNLRAELDNLARVYLRLAEHADRNAKTDVSYETPPRNV
jgi:hypothetical protein